MKQLLLSLFLFVALTDQTLTAQITTHQIKARFGVEADLRANYYLNTAGTSGFITIGSDDWFKNDAYSGPGIGDFIIDTTGAASILALYNSQPATRNYPFFRNMRYPQFHVLNGMLLIDAIFIRDHHGDVRWLQEHRPEQDQAGMEAEGLGRLFRRLFAVGRHAQVHLPRRAAAAAVSAIADPA